MTERTMFRITIEAGVEAIDKRQALTLVAAHLLDTACTSDPEAVSNIGPSWGEILDSHLSVRED
jgi:hypothetical protein